MNLVKGGNAQSFEGFVDCINDLRNPFDIFILFFKDQNSVNKAHKNIDSNDGLIAIRTNAYDSEGYLLHTPIIGK